MEATASATDSAPGLAAAAGELLGSVRALIADEADLVAMEAHAALRTVIAMVAVAVGAAVLGVLAAGALLGVVAVELVAHGMSWPVTFGVLALACAAGSASLTLVLRGLALRTFFAASRRELRGRS
ncbi:MAG: hypothetical protein M3R31_01675 [Pseudomonadota bacterium]|nr:hypothetical protein [Pseudomonadota bacterium]